MSDATTHLLLPYILAAQAQKHVTHNEALRILDGLVQLSVLDRDLTAPPGSPADGDRYIVGSGATGDWAGWNLNVALWTDGAWLRLPPRTGWRAWVQDEGLLLVYDGSSWIGTTPSALQNLALLGIGTAADASNPFSAKLNAALWTAKTVAEGGTGDLFYTLNKEAAGDDLGLTLQTGFVTKALVGLFGSDRFRLAVSADGSTFFDGLSVDNATGIVDQPRLPRFKAWTNYDNYVGVGTWTKIAINNTDYNDQGAFDAANNHFVAPADGTYLFGATLLYKINASATARMRGRLVLNGTTEIRGSPALEAGLSCRRPPMTDHPLRHWRDVPISPGAGRTSPRRDRLPRHRQAAGQRGGARRAAGAARPARQAADRPLGLSQPRAQPRRRRRGRSRTWTAPPSTSPWRTTIRRPSRRRRARRASSASASTALGTSCTSTLGPAREWGERFPKAVETAFAVEPARARSPLREPHHEGRRRRRGRHHREPPASRSRAGRPRRDAGRGSAAGAVSRHPALGVHRRRRSPASPSPSTPGSTTGRRGRR
jgi:hypothetical protein